MLSFCRLENTSSNHNKFYELTISKVGEMYHLTSTHGKIGTTGVTAVIHKGKDLPTTHLIMTDRMNLKVNQRGYKIVKSPVNLTDSFDNVQKNILNTAKETKKITQAKAKKFSIYSPGRMRVFL